MLFDLFNQVHQIDFDDENNLINKNVFMHREGEIWHISASPLDKSILATCYNRSKLFIFSFNLINLSQDLETRTYWVPKIGNCKMFLDVKFFKGNHDIHVYSDRNSKHVFSYLDKVY